jgi:dienelactone hydrolase
LILAPEWWGLNRYAKNRAQEFASEGYVVLAVDFYGMRKVASGFDEAGKLAGTFYSQPVRFRNTMMRALNQLKERSDVDPERIGAMGFCFGGTAVLEGARAGLPLKAVGCFHGSTKPFAATPRGAVKGRILILHGGADPHVTLEDVAAGVRDLEAAKADYGVILYPHAVHAFTNPDAGDDVAKGIAYNAAAEKASMADFRRFLAQSGMAP